MKRLGIGLMALVLSIPRVGAAQEIQTRRLSVPDGFWASGVSWDGRYFSSSYFGLPDHTPGTVALLDIGTFAVEDLTSRADPASSAFPDWAQVSRDGGQVAYTMWNGIGWDLRVVAKGGEPRILLDMGDGYPYPTDWSPDGRHIVVPLDSLNRDNRIALVSMEDGSTRILQSLGDRFPGPPRMSPDGRYVAYDVADEAMNLDRDIWVVSAEGGRATKVVDSPGTDLLLGWLPDGSGLLFQSDRDGTDGWWAQAVQEGRRSGGPTLVKPDMWGDPVALGMTRDGSLYYTVTVGRREAYIAGFDAGTGELNGSLQRISDGYALYGGRIAWSPDGGQVAFVAREGRPAWGAGRDKIVVWTGPGSELRELTPNVAFIGQLAWEPDGGSFLVTALRRGVEGMYRVDARTGDVTDVWTGDWPRHFALTRDGRTAYFHKRRPPEGVVALDLASGQVRELYVKPPDGMREFDMRYGFGGLQLSHDERTLLLRSYGSEEVLSLPTSGGRPRVLLRLEDGERAVALRWAPDDASAFVTTRRGWDTPDIDQWRISLDDGTREHVARCTQPDRAAPCHGQISPDGRRIAFGVGEARSEVWVARGFGR